MAFIEIMKKEQSERSELETVIYNAILVLSNTVYSGKTSEEIYELLRDFVVEI